MWKQEITHLVIAEKKDIFGVHDETLSLLLVKPLNPWEDTSKPNHTNIKISQRLYTLMLIGCSITSAPKSQVPFWPWCLLLQFPDQLLFLLKE
jgi:hypothetical protein